VVLVAVGDVVVEVEVGAVVAALAVLPEACVAGDAVPVAE